MIQLIIGISLGLILLFVVVLLITEMAATYPVWRQFDKNPFSRPTDAVNQNKTKRSRAKYALLALSIVFAFCFVAILIGSANPPKGNNKMAEKESENLSSLIPLKKYLTDSLAEQGLLFTTLTKWEDGKVYCNHRVLFQKAVNWNFTDWHYSLLDKDGFLIKDFHFTQNDFIVDTKDGRTTALLNRCNAAMTLNEYQRITSLQVILDKKMSSE